MLARGKFSCGNWKQWSQSLNWKTPRYLEDQPLHLLSQLSIQQFARNQQITSWTCSWLLSSCRSKPNQNNVLWVVAMGLTFLRTANQSLVSNAFKHIKYTWSHERYLRTKSERLKIQEKEIPNYSRPQDYCTWGVTGKCLAFRTFQHFSSNISPRVYSQIGIRITTNNVPCALFRLHGP